MTISINNERSTPRKSSILRNATLATAVSIGLFAPHTTSVDYVRIESTSVTQQECKTLSKLMYNASPFEDAVTFMYANPEMVGKIMQNAENAAERLHHHVSKEFIFVHWAMESGILNLPNLNAIQNNNFAGIMTNRKLRHYKSIDLFVDDYVETLRHAGLDGVDGNQGEKLLAVADKLDGKHYANKELETTYFSKILGIARLLKDVSPEFGAFYTQCIETRSKLYERRALLVLERK